jgi:hypothetical protein
VDVEQHQLLEKAQALRPGPAGQEVLDARRTSAPGDLEAVARLIHP